MSCFKYKYKGKLYTGKEIIPVIMKIVNNGSSKRTEAQLNNRMRELWVSILQNPKNYDKMMGSIDDTFLEDKVKGIIARRNKSSANTSNLSQMTLHKQAEIKRKYMIPKDGVASVASDIANLNLNKNTDISLKEPLVVFKKTNGEEVVFQRANVSKEVVLWDKESGQEVIHSGDKVHNTPKSVATTMSVIANAYLDFAGNPYIIDANFKPYIYDVVSLMVTTGLQTDMITSFMMNPAIEMFSEAISPDSSLYQGYTDKWQLLSNKIKKRFNVDISKSKLEAFSKYKNDSDAGNNIFTQYSLAEMDAFASYESKMSEQDVLNMLSTFSYLRNISSNSRPTKKQNDYLTKGSGSSVAEMKGKENNNRSIESDSNPLTNIGKKFNTGFVQTPLSKAIDNTDGIIADVGKKFLSSFNTGVIAKIESINGEIRSGKNDIEAADRLSRNMYAYMYINNLKSFTNYRDINQLITDLFKGGDNSMVQRLSQLQDVKLHPEYANNQLIHGLMSTLTEEGYGFVHMKTETINNAVKQRLQDDFNVIAKLNPEFAQDLVSVAMITTGFNMARHSFVNAIPERYYYKAINEGEYNNLDQYTSSDITHDSFMDKATLLNDANIQYFNNYSLNKKRIGINQINDENVKNSLKAIEGHLKGSDKTVVIMPNYTSNVFKVANERAKKDSNVPKFIHYVKQGSIVDGEDVYKLYVKSEKIGYQSEGMTIKEMDSELNMYNNNPKVPMSYIESNFLHQKSEIREGLLHAIEETQKDVSKLLSELENGANGAIEQNPMPQNC